MIKNSMVLVAGGAGFIGSHLVNKLMSHGNEVVVVDDLSTGSIDNIAHHMGSDNFEFHKEDIIDAEMEFDGEYVFNLACPASPKHYQMQPFQTMMTNVQGTYELLNMVQQNGGAMIQASTSEVYGDPLQHPQTEDYLGNVNPLGPRACYDEGKRAAEALCADFRRHHYVDVHIARIFNTYGPNMAVGDGRVVSNFITQAILGRPLTVFGDGMQTRSLCYVSDTVDALIRMSQIDQMDLCVLNIGNPHEVTMIELAEKVIARTKSSSKIMFLDLPEDDPKRRKPDITRAKEKIKWEPKVSLDDGLDMTIEYFRKSVSCLQ